MAWIAALIQIGLTVFGWFRRRPSNEAVAAAKAATAETKLAVEVRSNAQVAKAAAAAASVDAALVRDPDGVRARDRYSRD